MISRVSPIRKLNPPGSNPTLTRQESCSSGGLFNNDKEQRPIISFAFPSAFPAQNSIDSRTKQCSRCKLYKSYQQFYTDKRHSDRLSSACKECLRIAQRKKRHTPEGKAKLGAYHQTENFRNSLARYHKSEKGKCALLKAQKNQHNLHPEKVRCRWIFQKALKTGKIIRPSVCEDCGKECKPDGHHEDYSKPLEVNWLCDKCHKIWDGKKSKEILHPDTQSLQRQTQNIKDWFSDFDKAGAVDTEVGCPAVLKG